MDAGNKRVTLAELARLLEDPRRGGKKVVHCHGVFDLLHVGHIKHLQAAKSMGDILVVTLTQDEHVNKGPHRPAFTASLRAEALASLACVDYVAVNEWPTAVETIRLLKPDLFVKGAVEEGGKRDHSDAFSLEVQAVQEVGGRLVLTEEDTYSSSHLINRYVDVLSPDATAFLSSFRERHSIDELTDYLASFRDARVLVIGEAILDEYVFCSAMAKANKEPHLATRFLREETYAGGSLAIANHLASFCDAVGLLSFLGEGDAKESTALSRLNGAVSPHFLRRRGAPTIVKRRFIESYFMTKLFEMVVMGDDPLGSAEEKALCEAIEQRLPEYDAVLAADYGHGLLTPDVVSLLTEKAPFLSVNVQTNPANYGFNVISKYPWARFVSIQENELRLEHRDPTGDIKGMMDASAERMSAKQFLVTRGSNGCVVRDRDGFNEAPAFSVKVVDRIGAGDAVLALTTLCALRGVPSDVMAFMASVVGAEACAIMGNSRSVDAEGLVRHLVSLLK